MPTAKRGAETVLCTMTRSSSTCTMRRKLSTTTTPITGGSTAPAIAVTCVATQVGSPKAPTGASRKHTTARAMPTNPAAARISIAPRSATSTSSAIPAASAAVAWPPTLRSSQIEMTSRAKAIASPARKSPNIQSGRRSPETRDMTIAPTSTAASTIHAARAANGSG